MPQFFGTGKILGDHGVFVDVPSINCLIDFSGMIIYINNFEPLNTILYIYIQKCTLKNRKKKCFHLSPMRLLHFRSSNPKTKITNSATGKFTQRLLCTISRPDGTQNLTISFFTKIKPRTLCLCLGSPRHGFNNDQAPHLKNGG